MSAIHMTCEHCGQAYIAGMVGSTPWPLHVCAQAALAEASVSNPDGTWRYCPECGFASPDLGPICENNGAGASTVEIPAVVGEHLLELGDESLRDHGIWFRVGRNAFGRDTDTRTGRRRWFVTTFADGFLLSQMWCYGRTPVEVLWRRFRPMWTRR